MKKSRKDDAAERERILAENKLRAWRKQPLLEVPPIPPELPDREVVESRLDVLRGPRPKYNATHDPLRHKENQPPADWKRGAHDTQRGAIHAADQRLQRAKNAVENSEADAVRVVLQTEITELLGEIKARLGALAARHDAHVRAAHEAREKVDHEQRDAQPVPEKVAWSAGAWSIKFNPNANQGE